MSLTDKVRNNLEPGLSNANNITYRRKISAVSTSTRGEDEASESTPTNTISATPRNCYSRNNVAPLRRRMTDEIDGIAMSTAGATPVEQRAAEIRRLNSRGETSEINNASPHEGTLSVQPATSIEKKKSTSSLASVFRSRASSPIEKMRKLIGRPSSKQPKEPKDVAYQPTVKEKQLSCELDEARNELAQLKITLNENSARAKSTSSSYQQCDVQVKNVSVMTDSENNDRHGANKENVDPDIICLGNNENVRVHQLEQEVAALKKENAEKTEEFRQTRKDFILILKEAVLRKNQAEDKLRTFSANIVDDEDWASLTSEHRRILRRNVLLSWAQKVLEPYAEHVTVSNFSSDWTDCRAFCALIHAVLPEVFNDEDIFCLLQDDCVSYCRRIFEEMQLPFDATALGLETSHLDSSQEDVSSTVGLTDWRYVMNTVFEIYKRGVLRK